MTRTVSLRPLQAADVDALWAARTRSTEPWADTSDAALRKLRERVTGSGRVTNGELLLGIVANGELAGEVQARQPEMGLPPGVFEIGIEIFDPAARGGGIGRRALAQFVAHLFEEEHAHRVQLTTDVDNVAMRRVAERLGFGREGTLRGFMPSVTGPRDYAMYGITREDYEEVKDRWTSTG
ncbi:MAG TPA: GNAT family protein [Actinomycetota bacterium]|nr:GNAT family protein [Actinomycetota bacterium]